MSGEPTSSKRLPSLDGLRAVSILFVLAAHSMRTEGFPESYFQSWSVFASRLAVFGVTIFFVISGFLITTLLLKERAQTGRINLKCFYMRRMLRIFPVYYLYIATIFILTLVTGLDVPPRNYLHALTYTSNFWVNSWVFGHTWSLSVEEQFYLFWPLLVARSKKALLGSLTCIVLLSSAVRAVSYRFPDEAVYFLQPFFAYADSLMIGALLALVAVYKPAFLTKRRLKPRLLQPLLLVVLIGMFYLSYHAVAAKITVPFQRTVASLSIAYFVACLISVQEGLLFKIMNSRLLSYIGVLSYSLYVWQQLFLYDKTRYSWDSVFFTFPYNLLATFAIAAASYHLWEKPFLRRREKFSMIGTCFWGLAAVNSFGVRFYRSYLENSVEARKGG